MYRWLIISLLIIFSSVSSVKAQDSAWFIGSPFFRVQFTSDSFYISRPKALLWGDFLTNSCYTDYTSGTTFFSDGVRLYNSDYELVENGDSLVYDSLEYLYNTYFFVLLCSI